MAKLIDVSGHLLTPGQHVRYLGYLESRMQQGHREHPLGINAYRDHYEQMALDDFLAEHRPSHRAKDQIRLVYDRVLNAMTAVGSMREYPYWIRSTWLPRAAGCELLKKLSLDLLNASTALDEIQQAVEAENTEKLHQWIERRQHRLALRDMEAPQS